MLDPAEPFFLYRGNKLTVNNDCRARVAMVGVDS
jgi:hypothetical protein